MSSSFAHFPTIDRFLLLLRSFFLEEFSLPMLRRSFPTLLEQSIMNFVRARGGVRVSATSSLMHLRSQLIIHLGHQSLLALLLVQHLSIIELLERPALVHLPCSLLPLRRLFVPQRLRLQLHLPHLLRLSIFIQSIEHFQSTTFSLCLLKDTELRLPHSILIGDDLLRPGHRWVSQQASHLFRDMDLMVIRLISSSSLQMAEFKGRFFFDFILKGRSCLIDDGLLRLLLLADVDLLHLLSLYFNLIRQIPQLLLGQVLLRDSLPVFVHEIQSFLLSTHDGRNLGFPGQHCRFR